MKKNNSHYADGITTLILFVVFAAGIISVIFAGAGAYSRLSRRDDALENERICERYLSTKIQSARSPGTVSVEKIGECDSLCLAEELNGEEYATYIWCSGGWLRESFMKKDVEIREQSGERILQAECVSFGMENGLIKIDVTMNGRDSYLYVDVRGAEVMNNEE